MGTLRLILALAVVGFHTYYQGNWSDDLPFWLPDGRAAVQMFYVISGFYMALVLNEKYRGTTSNWLFYTNRFLRLWPSVMVVNIFVILSFLAIGEVRLFLWTGSFAEFFAFLGSLDIWALIFVALTNLFVVGQDILFFLRFDASGVSFVPVSEPGHNGASLSLNHPLFTVAIEAFNYIISPFVLRRGWRVALGFLLVGGIYHMAIYIAGVSSLMWGYHFVGSAAYFYFLGACAYHLYRQLNLEPWRDWLERRQGPAMAACILALLLTLPINWLVPRSTLFMAPILAAVIPVLFTLTRHRRWDRLVGELSFGVYLVHYPILFLVGPAFDHLVLWLVIGALSVTAAILLLVLVDLPIDRRRQRRAAAAARGEPEPRHGWQRQRRVGLETS
jgi:peptidoglycan/LPS O-acetylase OafA/YrhL